MVRCPLESELGGQREAGGAQGEPGKTRAAGRRFFRGTLAFAVSPSIKSLLGFFDDADSHPPSFGYLLAQYSSLAGQLAESDHPELEVALRKLLESRDAALRALRALAERDTVPIEPWVPS